MILDQIPTRQEGKPRRSHGKIGFADLGMSFDLCPMMNCNIVLGTQCMFSISFAARSIAEKWKAVSKEDRAVFDQKAAQDKRRYQHEMEVWRSLQPQLHPEEEGEHIEATRPPPARIPAPPVHRTEQISSHLSSAPQTGWLSAAPTQNQPPSADSVGSASHPVAAFERDFDGVQENGKNSDADWMSLHDLVFANRPQAIPAAAAHAVAMSQQHVSLPEVKVEPLALFQRDAAEEQPQQIQEGLKALARKLDDESTDLFVSMFRPSE